MGPEQMFRLALCGETNLDVMDITKQGLAFEGRMKSLVDSNPGLTTGALAAGAVAGTLLVTYAAYKTMANRLDKVHDERENYQDMMEQGISTYFLAYDQQKRHAWDHYIASYVKNLRATLHPTLNDLLWCYAGIHQKTIEQHEHKGTVYGAMSTFATPLGAYFPQIPDDSDALTQARKSLNIFISGELKEKLLEVESKLKAGWLTNLKLLAEAERYLPWLNATRILLISLGNAASNLLFAMNPNTGMPLSYENSAALCSLFRELLGAMRSEQESMFYAHRSSLCCYESFDDFLSILDSKVLVLKKAYECNAETKLNLNEISNSMHLILQQLNTSFRALIYLNQPFSDPVHLLGKILYLADLIRFHPELTSALVAKLKVPKDFNYRAMMVNNPAVTVMDVLILWSHAKREIRSSVLSNMPQKEEWEKQFIKTLWGVEKYFIKPIEKKSTTKHMWGLYRTAKTSFSPAQLFLISSIAILMEIYRLQLPESESPSLPAQTGNQQIRAINAQATLENAQYGVKIIFELIFRQKETYEALIKVIILSYELLPLLKSVDMLDLIGQNNQRVANTNEFQAVLLKRLQALQKKQEELKKAIMQLIRTAEGEKKSDKDALMILTGLNNKNIKTALSLPEIDAEFDRQIRHSIRMLEESTYDELLEEKTCAHIAMLQAVDSPGFFPTQEAFDAFYDALRESVRSRDLIQVQEPPAQLLISNPLGVITDKDKHNESVLPETIHEEKTSYAFQWQVLSIWLSRVSIALLLIGLFMVLLMTFGSQTIPAIAALSAPTVVGIAIGGLVSAVGGGLGLAAAYYTPRLFKSTPPPSEPIQAPHAAINLVKGEWHSVKGNT